MATTTDRDWQPGARPPLALTALAGGEEIVELAPSPDGRVMAAVTAGDRGMRVRTLDAAGVVATWPEAADRYRQLTWSDDGRLAALAARDDAWTVVEDAVPWPERHEFAWDLRRTPDGRLVAAVRTDAGYALATAGAAWPRAYTMLREWRLAPAGARTACTVQVAARPEADVAAYAAGLWSVAVDGEAWARRFVSAWDPAFSGDGARVAALVRLDRRRQTVAVDGEPWVADYPCAWGPSFAADGAVLAPVRTDGGWTLARDGEPRWRWRFVQLWRQTAAADGRVAAVVAPVFGRWTVAVDDRPWAATWDEWVGTPVFAGGEDRRIACAVKSGGRWTVAVDGRTWDLAGDRLQGPLIPTPGGPVVAALERSGRWRLVADGRPVGGSWARPWPLAVGPHGDRIVMRGLDADGAYRSAVHLLADLRRGEGSGA